MAAIEDIRSLNSVGGRLAASACLLLRYFGKLLVSYSFPLSFRMARNKLLNTAGARFNAFIIYARISCH